MDLVQIERVDDICIVCDKRHTPKWLEEAMEQDAGLRHMLRPLGPSGWVNVHDFTKRAFVPLELRGKAA